MILCISQLSWLLWSMRDHSTRIRVKEVLKLIFLEFFAAAGFPWKVKALNTLMVDELIKEWGLSSILLKTHASPCSLLWYMASLLSSIWNFFWINLTSCRCHECESYILSTLLYSCVVFCPFSCIMWCGTRMMGTLLFNLDCFFFFTSVQELWV